MKASNQELKELIENMLETYRLEQKKIKLDKSKNYLNPLINSIVEEMGQIAIETDHKISVDISQTENFELEFDVFQLKRVIKNLIQNAISFSPNSLALSFIILTNISSVPAIFSAKATAASLPLATAKPLNIS